ncbi:MAG: carboxypeptidase regulatory-like domain-containing protein [Acidobacteria bacterium]|nr:carboxypeptidase regulatory-like domain-containing protein [Acidobacteriota bacterium]
MLGKKVALLLGLQSLLSLPLRAQEPAPAAVRATGVVRTSQGVAVPGATLRLVELASGRAWMAWTEESGRFELPGLPRGRYRVEAEQIGFDPAAKEIELSARAPAIELSLRVAALAAPAAQATPHVTPAKAASETQPNAAAPGATKPGAPSEAAAAVSAPGGKLAPGTPPPGATPPAPGQGSGARRPGQALPPNIAEMIRQRMRQGGFQEVDPTGQAGGAGPDANGAPDAGPLGEASSSDAFLISGTVGRGATAGSDGGFGFFGGLPPGGFGGFGVPGQGGAFPGQQGAEGAAGAFNIPMIGAVPGGPGQPQRQGGRGGQGQGQQRQRGAQGAQQQGGQRAAFGEGTEGLWGLQRVLRQQVNRIRVSFYERYGNAALDARPYSLTETNPAKIPTWRERFGGSLGGPLRIPRVYDGREKTFFFVNYNAARTRDPVDTFATVPLAAERLGDFTARGVQLFDPLSNPNGPRTPLGSVIPASRLDAAALGLLRFIPLPNLPGLVQNFHWQTRVPTATDSFNVRVLHTISSKLNFQATYNFSATRTHAFQNFPSFESNTSTRGQNVMLGLTQHWTKRFLHDTRVFWSRNRINTLNQFAFNEDVAGQLGITGVSTDPRNFGVPQVALTNFTDLNDPVPALRRNQTLRFLDNLSYSLPRHTLRAGAEIRRMQLNTRTDPTPRGAFHFTGLLTSQLDATGQPVAGTGFDLADFLLGLPQSTSERFGTSSTYFRSWGFVGYFQDDWRIHPRFSLNSGLRYEAVTPPVELLDQIANLDVNADFTAVATVTPGQAAPFNGPLPRSLVRGDHHNWSPRVGMAWKPPLGRWTQKRSMTVRAGYGIFYNTSIYNQLAASMANQPPFATAQTRLSSAMQLLTLENGFPPAPASTVRNTVAVDPNYRVGYAQIWNFTIETQLAQSLSTEVTYTATQGTHLDLLRAPNRAPAGAPLDRRISDALGFTYDTFGASSTYHALQVRVQRRFTKGFMLQGLYTYGKSIDNASSIGGGAPVVAQNDNNFALERGLSSFDVRHQFRTFYVYELPFGERKRWAHKGWQAAAFGNWTLSGNTTVQTGTPFTARVLGGSVDNGGVGAGFSSRADQVGSPSLPAGQRDPLHFFNTAAFVLPPPGRFGNAGRNTIPGPGLFTFIFALARRMSFGKDKQRRLDLRWEVSNLTNTPNFTGLSTVVNSTTYGRVMGARPMRSMDFVMRVNF